LHAHNIGFLKQAIPMELSCCPNKHEDPQTKL
jgi:hypothetical protein